MADPESSSDPLIGRVIGGKFEVEELIGRGGMGAVYRARQKNLKRVVAIKVLRHELLDDPTYAARFKREANAASQLDHPNLMRVIDFGEDADLLYIAMEYIDGRPLHAVIRDESPLDTARIVDIVSQLLAALAIMHDEGIIHRDLKPENVMVVRGKDDDGHAADVVKLCDFGIAKQLAVTNESGEPGVTHTATLTATGALVGTPDYMSPEQAKGDLVDARSDLYALGVILYQMLAGRLPFRSANSMKVLLAHVSEAPAPPSIYQKGVDPLLEEICLRALAKSREDRFQSARDMRAAVRAAQGMRESSVTDGARRALSTRSSMPPPPAPRIHDEGAPTIEEVLTRRGGEGEIRAALSADTPAPRSGSSGSGIVQRSSVGQPVAATLTSGTSPSEARAKASAPTTPKPAPVSSRPPPKRSDPPPPAKAIEPAPVTVQTPAAAPQQSRAVVVLLAIVAALLAVIALLLVRK
jgi:serine/threonine-protein kinase